MWAINDSKPTNLRFPMLIYFLCVNMYNTSENNSAKSWTHFNQYSVQGQTGSSDFGFVKINRRLRSSGMLTQHFTSCLAYTRCVNIPEEGRPQQYCGEAWNLTQLL